MNKYKAILYLVGLGLLLSLIIPLFVRPSIILSLELVGVCLHLGAAALFLSSLGNFKTLLKVAYTCIAIGYVFAGLGALQLPVVAMIGGITSKWVESGLVGIPFLLAMISLYTGTVIAARLFSIHNFVSRPYLVVPLGIILGVTMGTLAPGTSFDAAAHVYTMLATIYLCTALLIYTTRNQASKRYSTSLGFLSIAFALGGFSLLHNLLVHLILPADHWYVHSAYVTLGNVMPGVAALISSYSFAKLGLNADATFMEQDPSATSVDVIVYMASLVSNKRDVDTVLDGLRKVTARIKKDQPISGADQKQLAQVYVSLEEYLVRKEALQKFSFQDLQRIMMRRFVNVKQINPVFWTYGVERRGVAHSTV